MRGIIAVSAAMTLGACSTCGSLRSASPPAPPEVVPLQTSQILPGGGDRSRIEISGQLYWLERQGPSGEGEVRIVDLSDPARPTLARQAVLVAPGAKSQRFTIVLDAEALPASARLGLEAMVEDPSAGRYQSLAPAPLERSGARGLRLRLARPPAAWGVSHDRGDRPA
jgi:hypothetical protein